MKNILRDILSGHILAKIATNNLRLILYIASLLVLLIYTHFAVRSSLLSQVQNEDIIKNLNFEYTSQSTRLLYLSKKDEIKNRLEKQESKLTAPENPPTIVKAVK